MARRSDGEKIDELDRLVPALAERVSVVEREGRELYIAHAGTVQAFSDYRRESEREVALLKREVEELKRDRERWTQRAWMVLAPLIAAAVGVAIGMKK